MAVRIEALVLDRQRGLFGAQGLGSGGHQESGENERKKKLHFDHVLTAESMIKTKVPYGKSLLWVKSSCVLNSHAKSVKAIWQDSALS